MNTRTQLLSFLRTKHQNHPRPDTWQSSRQFDDLIDRFTISLTKSGGKVFYAPTLVTVIEHLNNLFQNLAPNRIVANAESPLTDFDLLARWPKYQWHIVGQTPNNLRAFCASADIGLSSADAALAETGTIVISSGPDRSRLASLLPPIHIALVPIACLTTDLFTWTAARKSPPPACLTLISGPSKTADIEQTMAVGVHGPKQFIVILYAT